MSEKYGEARYEDQLYREGSDLGGNVARETDSESLPMIEPEGLTPGYMGFDRSPDDLVESVDASKEDGPTTEPMEQMHALQAKKIEAMMDGDASKVAQIEQMIALHAKRNDLPYTPS